MPKGNEAVLLMKKQTAKGTPATLSASDYAIPFLSESLRAAPTIYQSEALRASALRDRRLARLGTLDVSGGVELEPTNQGLHLVLPMFFPGTPTAVGSAVAPNYSVQYKPGIAEADYITVGVSDGEVIRTYSDMRLGSMSLSADINQLARMSLDMAGINITTANGTLAGNIPALEYGLYFEHAVVTLGNSGGALAQVPATSFQVSFNKNLNTNRYQLGSRYRRDVTSARWDITGSFNIEANPLADKDALYDSVLQAQWMALKLVFSDPTNEVDVDGAGSGALVPSKLEVDIPYALLEWPGHNISGPDYIEGGVNFTAFAEGATSPTITHVYKLDL